MEMNNYNELFSLAKEAFAAGQFKTAELQLSWVGDIYNQVTATSKSAIDSPKYSIIVVNYLPSDDFVAMLESLKKYESNDEFELLIVNNGNPYLPAVVEQTLSNCTILDVGFNFGCSGGRNVGLHFARGKYCLFIDDDGVLSELAIEELIETIERYQAVTCRGKVEPKSEGSIAGGNYNKGDSVTVSIPDAEGISIWRSDVLRRFGGFDPLLSGHEGLCSWIECIRA